MTALIDLAGLLVQAYAACARDGAVFHTTPTRRTAIVETTVSGPERVTNKGEGTWVS